VCLSFVLEKQAKQNDETCTITLCAILCFMYISDCIVIRKLLTNLFTAQQDFALSYPGDGRVASLTRPNCQNSYVNLQNFNVCAGIFQLWSLSSASSLGGGNFLFNDGCPDKVLDIEGMFA
jgi:hypothetical protein